MMNSNRFLTNAFIIVILATSSAFASSIIPEPQPIEPFTLKPYRINYFFPVHYRDKPDRDFFRPLNPNNRDSKKTDIEFQISLYVDLLKGLFAQSDTVRFAYTQNAYWQAYDKSAYFRDTDYQPELLYQLPLKHQWGNWRWQSGSLGFWHESNGKGGSNERSWNRIFLGLIMNNDNFYISLKPWVRLKLSHDYNNDISHYRGHGEIECLYQTEGKQQFMVKSRNDLDSGFSRGYEEVAWLVPVTGNLRGFIKLTSGYGESISNYNHYSNSVGIGVALSGW